MEQLTDLLKWAPPRIQTDINNVSSARDDSKGHVRLLELAESCIGHLASLGLSEYRSAARPAIPVLEAFLSERRILSIGDFPRIVQFWLNANSDLLPDHRKSKLAAPGRLKAAVEAIQHHPGTSSVAALVERSLKQGDPKVGWLEAWVFLARYRNQSSGHTVAHDWPSRTANDYFPTMRPLLAEALTEMLSVSEVAFRDYYVATLERVESLGSGTFDHQLNATRGGAAFQPDVEQQWSVLDQWNDDIWRAEVGGQFLLGSDPIEIIGPYWDLVSGGVPPNLPLEDEPGDLEGVGVGDRSSAAPPRTSAADPDGDESKLDALQQEADELGVGIGWRRILESASSRGLQLRPQLTAVRVTPPTDRVPFLLYVALTRKGGPGLHIDFGYRQLSDHYPTSPGTALDGFGPSRRYEPGEDVSDVLDALDTFFDRVAAIDDRLSDGSGYLDEAVAGATESTIELISLVRDWARDAGYVEGRTISAVTWGPGSRRAVYLFPEGSGSVSLDLDSPRRRKRSAEARELLDVITARWDAKGTMRWQDISSEDAVTRWSAFEAEVLEPTRLMYTSP